METLDWWAKYIFYIAIPYFLVLMAWEWFALRRAKSKGKRGYEIKDSSTQVHQTRGESVNRRCS